MEQSQALEVFEFQGNKLQVIIHNGKAAIVGNELCEALGYKNPSDALSKLPEHQKDRIAIRDSVGRMRNTKIVYEGGWYKLAFGSKLPNAEAFTDLVTDVILPSIRKTGSYSLQGDKEVATTSRLDIASFEQTYNALTAAQNNLALAQQQLEEARLAVFTELDAFAEREELVLEWLYYRCSTFGKIRHLKPDWCDRAKYSIEHAIKELQGTRYIRG